MEYAINQQLSYFLKSKGITIQDLNRHPLIDDVILLVSIKDEFDSEFNQNQQEYLTNLWHYVYTNQYNLKHYHYTRLKKIVKALKSQRYNLLQQAKQQAQQLKAKEHKQAIIRGKIQRLRMKGSENPATQ